MLYAIRFLREIGLKSPSVPEPKCEDPLPILESENIYLINYLTYCFPNCKNINCYIWIFFTLDMQYSGKRQLWVGRNLKYKLYKLEINLRVLFQNENIVPSIQYQVIGNRIGDCPRTGDDNLRLRRQVRRIGWITLLAGWQFAFSICRWIS